MRVLLSFATCLLASACATPVMTTVSGIPAGIEIDASMVEATEADIKSDGNLVIVREYAEPTAWPTSLFVNGEKLVNLGQKEYLVVRLEPGTHTIKTDWPMMSGQTTATTDVTIGEDETVYIGILGSSSASAGGAGMEFRMAAGYTRLSPDLAPQALTYCCKRVGE